MARPLRIEYEGAVYHVTSRGNARSDIFLSTDDRDVLLDVLGEDRGRCDWMQEAYGEHGYTMQEIADYAGLHHSTVSRLIKKGEKNAQNKS